MKRELEVESFEELVKMMLLEELTNTVSRDVAVFLMEKECRTIEKAASLADKFARREHHTY